MRSRVIVLRSRRTSQGQIAMSIHIGDDVDHLVQAGTLRFDLNRDLPMWRALFSSLALAGEGTDLFSELVIDHDLGDILDTMPGTGDATPAPAPLTLDQLIERLRGLRVQHPEYSRRPVMLTVDGDGNGALTGVKLDCFDEQQGPVTSLLSKGRP